MLPFCRWLEQTSVGAGIRESLWLFPAIETLHLLGMAALVGTIAVFDLRLLGWMLRREWGLGVGGGGVSPSFGGVFLVGGFLGPFFFFGRGWGLYKNPFFWKIIF